MAASATVAAILVVVSAAFGCAVIARQRVADFADDGRTDQSVFRPSSAIWFVSGGATLTMGPPATSPSAVGASTGASAGAC